MRLATSIPAVQCVRVSKSSALIIRDVTVDEYPSVRRLIAAAFAGEPFARGMFGDSPIDRFSGLAADYAEWPSASDPVVLGVEAGGHLVGVALATLPGQCGLCDAFEPLENDALSHPERIEHEFQLACRHSHLSGDLAPHAHIPTVATESVLHGSGIGRLLMATMLDRLQVSGVEVVVLECLTSRAMFYERCGFRPIDEFRDPGGPTLRSHLMRADLPAVSTGV
jgi:GNAT superfamily N-acetyltransferase